MIMGIIIKKYFMSKPIRKDAIWTINCYWNLLLTKDTTKARFVVLLADKKILNEHKDCPICFESFKRNQYIFSCLTCKNSRVHLKCGTYHSGYKCCLCRKYCDSWYLQQSWNIDLGVEIEIPIRKLY